MINKCIKADLLLLRRLPQCLTLLLETIHFIVLRPLFFYELVQCTGVIEEFRLFKLTNWFAESKVFLIVLDQ